MPPSLTKTSLNLPELQSIVQNCFGSANQLLIAEELSDGYFNSAYRLELSDGLRCVLKIAPHWSIRLLRYEYDIMSAEIAVMDLVRTQTEMPVPKVLFHDTTRLLIENEYYLMEFIPGIPLNVLRPDLSGDEINEIDFRIGVYLRQMNAISGESFGYFPPANPRFSSWRAAFDYMLRCILADGQDCGVELPMSYEQLYSLCQSIYASLDEIESPCLVHWDLWDGNIFIDPTSRKIIGLIDFERALWGDPLMEVSFWGTPPESKFWQGYGREMLNTRADRERRRLYNIYWFSIMVIEGYYRKYPTNEIETWSRAQLVKALDEFN